MNRWKRDQRTWPNAFHIPARPGNEVSAEFRSLWYGPDPRVDASDAQSIGERLALVVNEARGHLSGPRREVNTGYSSTGYGKTVRGKLDRRGEATREPQRAVDGIIELLGQVAARLDAADRDLAAVSQPADTPPDLRVLLMGRTQAGKSTLLEALTGGDGHRIGDGGQRFTRDVHERPIPRCPGVRIIDTPGVGALDGQADFEAAFEQVRDADLVLWVASDDPTREQTAVALRALAVLGKPIIIVVNCHVDLDHRGHLLDFLDDPGRFLDGKSAHVAIIERQRSRLGSAPARWAVVHADAAYRASRGDEHADVLWAHSRVDSVVSLLEEERDRLLPQRRLVRDVDRVRRPITFSLAEMAGMSAVVRLNITLRRQVRDDVVRRLDRARQGVEEQLLKDITAAVFRRRRWHATADPEHLERDWLHEADRLHQGVEDLLRHADQTMAEQEAEVVDSVTAEWSSLPTTALPLGHLPGFGSVWANRAARALPVAGAIVGLLVGGPVGIAVGTLVGVAFDGLGSWLRSIFKGKAQIIRERREKAGEELRPILDKLQRHYGQAASHLVTQHADRLAQQGGEVEANLLMLEAVADALDDAGRHQDAALRRLDRILAIELLHATGRHRLAAGVRRSFRIPGVATAVALDDAAFCEAVRFPPTGGVERLVGCRANAPSAVGPTVEVVMGLTTSPLDVHLRDSTTVAISLPDPVPDGVLQAWSELAEGLIEARVVVTAPQHPASPATQTTEEAA